MYRGCTDQPASIESTSMDIGDGANLELVDKFCYLGDMLHIDVNADADVEARVCKGLNKFRQLVLLLTNKDILLPMREKLHRSCVLSCMLHGSEEREQVDTSVS